MPPTTRAPHAWQVTKLKSTFTDGLIAQINPHTGRVHTRLCMASAATGRLSSVDPNLQVTALIALIAAAYNTS